MKSCFVATVWRARASSVSELRGWEGRRHGQGGRRDPGAPTERHSVIAEASVQQSSSRDDTAGQHGNSPALGSAASRRTRPFGRLGSADALTPAADTGCARSNNGRAVGQASYAHRCRPAVRSARARRVIAASVEAVPSGGCRSRVGGEDSASTRGPARPVSSRRQRVCLPDPRNRVGANATRSLRTCPRRGRRSRRC
jgi:hypothetical protein